VLPRLAEAGADLDRCILLKKARSQDGMPFSLTLKRDIELLRRMIEETPDCRLVVIDPISAYLGDADGHNNQQVRTMLLPLVELAAERNVAVVMVSHLNKRASSRAMHRTMGSMAFVALARSAWLIAADPENARRRLMLSL